MNHQSALIAQLKMGDEKAVTTWFNQYQPIIYQFIASRISDRADIEELVQKTFIDSLRQISLLRDPTKLKAWMLNIARCRVADFYRKQYAKKVIKQLPLGKEMLALNTQDLPEVAEAVQATLNKMSAYSRELLLKKYVDRDQVSKIAKEQLVSNKTIESRLYRARQEFKSIYAKIS